jgi:hypothetical protein
MMMVVVVVMMLVVVMMMVVVVVVMMLVVVMMMVIVVMMVIVIVVIIVIGVHVVIVKVGNNEAFAVALRVERRSKIGGNGDASAIIGDELLLLNRRAAAVGLSEWQEEEK